MPEVVFKNNQEEENLIPEEVVSQDSNEVKYEGPTYAKDKPGFEDIGHGILVARDFLERTDFNYIKYQAEELPEEQWDTHPAHSRFQGVISTNLKVQSIAAKVIDTMMPEYWTNDHQTINRMRVGDRTYRFGWGAWGSADYVVLYYFGEFEGGEVVFLEKDGEEINFEFTPKENELYLLPIRDHEFYISKPVTKGTKYSFVDWLYRHGEWVVG